MLSKCLPTGSCGSLRSVFRAAGGRAREGLLRTRTQTVDEFAPVSWAHSFRGSKVIRKAQLRVREQNRPQSRGLRPRGAKVKAIVVTDQAAGTAGMKLAERPEPISDKRRHRSDSCVGIRPDRDGVALDLDRSADRDRSPSIPGHELAGVVTALGYGTTGLSVRQRVFGLSDWHRDGTLAEYVAIEARNLAPLPATSTSQWARACRSRD